MDIRRRQSPTQQPPPEWSTGPVWLDQIAAPPPPSRMRVSKIYFAPGGRTVWHRHEGEQILYVMDGVGRIQVRGEPVREIRSGDTVVIHPGVWHWHGASPHFSMTHISIHETDAAGNVAEWGEAVTEAEFLAEPVERDAI